MTDLITRLEKAAEEAAEGSRELDRAIWHELEFDSRREPTHCPSYTTSIDAALALAERVPVAPYTGPITLTIAGSGQAYIDHSDPCRMGVQAFGNTPALALCIAILKATTPNAGERG